MKFRHLRRGGWKFPKFQLELTDFVEKLQWIVESVESSLRMRAGFKCARTRSAAAVCNLRNFGDGASWNLRVSYNFRTYGTYTFLKFHNTNSDDSSRLTRLDSLDSTRPKNIADRIHILTSPMARRRSWVLLVIPGASFIALQLATNPELLLPAI